MKDKYNLVYVPLNKNAEITAIAQQFSRFAHQYLLGSEALPHVTLCQFEALEQDLEKIWARAEKMIHAKFMTLRFNKINVLDHKNEFNWVSLIPDQSEELYKLHDEALKVLEITDKVWFDPHMTLFNSVNKDYAGAVEDFSKIYQPIEDKFALALGTSGFLGQFKKVLFCEGVTA
jgi:2'-5' RNA ligase